MQRPSIEEFSGRPKSYTITVSSPGSEGSRFPSIDGTSPDNPQETAVIKEEDKMGKKNKGEENPSTVV